MTTVNIDNKEYDVDKLPENAKAQLRSLQFVDAELQRLAAQAAAYKTARAAYAKALQQALVELPASPFAGDTFKLS